MSIFFIILVGALAYLTVLHLRTRPEEMRRLLNRLERTFGPMPLSPLKVMGAGMALVFVLGLLLMSEPEFFPALLAVLLILGAALFVRGWSREFLFLMSLGDEEFNGRFDKLIWAIVLIFVPPVGLLAFRSYRDARWPVSEAKPEPARDLR